MRISFRRHVSGDSSFTTYAMVIDDTRPASSWLWRAVRRFNSLSLRLLWRTHCFVEILDAAYVRAYWDRPKPPTTP